MPHLEEFGAIEVIGTSGGESFVGREGTIFSGRQRADLFTSSRSTSLDPHFLGGSGTDTYVVTPSTFVFVAGGFGSANDVVRTTGAGFNFPYTAFAEIDGRHLYVADSPLKPPS